MIAWITTSKRMTSISSPSLSAAGSASQPMMCASALFAYAMAPQIQDDQAKAEVFKNIMSDGCNRPASTSLSSSSVPRHLMIHMEVHALQFT